MAHFKCVPCRTRLHRPASPPDLVGASCPNCGALLEPVGELAEVVGYQAIEPRDLAEVGRWLDDSDSFGPEAAAQAIALPTQEENP